MSALEVAEWHERTALSYAALIQKSLERWPDEGRPPRYVGAQDFHEKAAFAIRAAIPAQ